MHFSPFFVLNQCKMLLVYRGSVKWWVSIS